MPISSDTRPTGDTALWLIGGFKLIKGLLLVAVATGALHVLHKDVADVVAAWVAHVHVDPDNRYVARVLSTVSLLDERKLKAISAGTFLYSALLLTEGTGLLLRQRWATTATQRCSVSSACWLSRFSSSACARCRRKRSRGLKLVTLGRNERIRNMMTSLLGGLLVALAVAIPVASFAADPPTLVKATFAGGCFWCMEEAFESQEGVVSVTSGYTGGQKPNPTYEEVSASGTGHAESVEILYDPAKTNYRKLLAHFWRNVDPITPNAQFCDHGPQYRSAIFYHDEEQKRLAEETKQAIEASKRFKEPIVTEIVPASTFYPAEDYHQDFYKKNPIRYKFYKTTCGRVNRLKQLWGKP